MCKYVRNDKSRKRESLSCTETGILTLIKLWGWEDWQSCLPLSNTFIISGHRQPLQLNSTYLWPGKYFLFLCLPRDMTSNEPQKQTKREDKKTSWKADCKQNFRHVEIFPVRPQRVWSHAADLWSPLNISAHVLLKARLLEMIPDYIHIYIIPASTDKFLLFGQ